MSVESDPKFEMLKSRLQQNPDSLLFARVAEGLLSHGQVDEAIRVCEEGIRKHPYYVTGHMVLGKCYLQKKLFDLSEKEFKRVLLFDPQYIAAHKFYGDLMREVGWDNTCEMSYRKILQIDPLDRTAKEMLETLDRVKPRDQEVVAPLTDELKEASMPPVHLDDEQETVDEEEMLVADDTPKTEASVAPSPINIDDDLFADVPTDESEELPLDASESEKGFAGILDDIFEDEERDETPSDDVEKYPTKSALSTAAPEFAEPADAKPTEEGAPVENPIAELDQFEEETLEFDELAGLEEEATKNLKPLDDGEIAFLSDDEGEATPDEKDLFDVLDRDEQDEEVDTVDDASEHDSAAFLDDTPGDEEDIQTAFESAVEDNYRHIAPPPRYEERQEAEAHDETTTIEREKIVTPTLGEIYAAQGQYGKAISVFEVLLKKDPANTGYQDKISYLRKRLEESQNA